MDKDVIIACDFPNKKTLFKFLSLFKRQKLFLKIGYQLYYKEGNKLIKKLKKMGHRIFLDLKLHDIPNTVGNGVNSLSELNVDFLTIHALSGKEALIKANSNKSTMKLLAVTLLTSLNKKIIKNDFNLNINEKQLIEDLAKSTRDCSLDGIICSVWEAKGLKKKFPNLIIVCPGIRLISKNNDQKRVANPQRAKDNDVDFIVVGREITESSIPLNTYNEIKKLFLG